MRFVLRIGSREVLVFSRNRFVNFDSMESAAMVLSEYCQRESNLDALREGVQQDESFEWLQQQDDASMLVGVAQQVAKGRLTALVDAEGMMPWNWGFPATPTFPIDPNGAEGESEPLEPEEDELGEEEEEEEDAKPDPIIPPEYPRLAKRTADAVEETTEAFCATMDLLRYVGHEGAEESAVAKAMQANAAAEGGGVEQAAGDAAMKLAELGDTGVAPVPESAVKNALTATARDTGEGLSDVAELEGEKMDRLMGPDVEVPESALAPSLPDAAEHQGDAVVSEAMAAGEALEPLADTKLDDVLESGVAPILEQTSADQSQFVTETADSMALQMNAMKEKELATLPEGVVAPAMTSVASEQGQVIIDRVSGAGADLATTHDMEGVDLYAPPDSNVAGIMHGLANEQGEAIVGKVENAGAGLDGSYDMGDVEAYNQPASEVAATVTDLAGSQGASLTSAAFQVGGSFEHLQGEVPPNVHPEQTFEPTEPQPVDKLPPAEREDAPYEFGEPEAWPEREEAPETPPVLEMRFTDTVGAPLAGAKYVVEDAAGNTFEGELDPTGRLFVEGVEGEATVRLPELEGEDDG